MPTPQNGHTFYTQTIRWLLPTNRLSGFDHFVGLALKGLRNVKRKQLKSKSNEINRAINYIITENITLISRLLKAAGCVVAKKLVFKTKLAKETKMKEKNKRQDKYIAEGS